MPDTPQPAAEQSPASPRRRCSLSYIGLGAGIVLGAALGIGGGLYGILYGAGIGAVFVGSAAFVIDFLWQIVCGATGRSCAAGANRGVSACIASAMMAVVLVVVCREAVWLTNWLAAETLRVSGERLTMAKPHDALIAEMQGDVSLLRGFTAPPARWLLSDDAARAVLRAEQVLPLVRTQAADQDASPELRQAIAAWGRPDAKLPTTRSTFGPVCALVGPTIALDAADIKDKLTRQLSVLAAITAWRDRTEGE